MSAAQKKHLVEVSVLVPVEDIIRPMRGQKVILDTDLARLYGVKAIALRQQVKRNKARFPADFMFQINGDEVEALVSQSVIASRRSLGGSLPYAFTQEGVAMLSSVLRSPRAIEMNIRIMRAFVRMRELLAAHQDIVTRLEKLETAHERSGGVIEILVEDIDKLAKEIHWIKNPPLPRKHPIGFVVAKEKA